MSKSKVIMRCAKLKSFGNIGASLSHNYRERETPNADAERTRDNVHLVSKNTDEAMGRLRSLLPDKRRKDAVLAIEYVMSASPDWWKQATEEQQQDFYSQSHNWLSDKYGEQNIISFSVHKDETSPHVSAIVVPVTEQGKLSAAHYIGSRGKLRADQTTYAKTLEHLGLERGLEGSKTTHRAIKDYYKGVNQAANEKQPEIKPEMLQPRVLKKGGLLKKEVTESSEQVAQRLTRLMQAYYEPYVAKSLDYDRQHSKESRERAKRTELAEIKEQQALKRLALESKQLRKELTKQLSVEEGKRKIAELALEKATSFLSREQKKEVGDAVREKVRGASRGRGRGGRGRESDYDLSM